MSKSLISSASACDITAGLSAFHCSDGQYLEVSERLVWMTETSAWFVAAEHDCPERILVWVKSNTQLIWTYDGTQVRLDDGRVRLIETSAQAYRCIGPAHECLGGATSGPSISTKR